MAGSSPSTANKANGVLFFNPPELYKAREFYIPKYEHLAAHEDLRSTIYWNPEVLTDKNGNASFSYPMPMVPAIT
jgi:hypothetical protein